MKPCDSIKQRFVELYAVWRREFRIVLGDVGVMVFFFGLPVLYPVVYTLIYNPEVARDIPVAVVDNCRTAGSREFVRMADAAEAISITGYAADLNEARRWMNEKACYGIMVIPEEYSRKIGRGEQAVIPFYVEMSLLLRYRAFLTALTDLSIAAGVQIRQLEGLPSVSPVGNAAIFLGDPTQGFASFVIPGILVLILQQSLILGITMLGGGVAERRRLYGGRDPLAVKAPAAITVMGKSLCYFTLYIPLIIYILVFIPRMFSLPHYGSVTDVLLFIVPLVFASIFMGMALQRFVRERESSMIMFVFTSVIFLFLSGLTWPRYAMSPLWLWVGDAIPSTWGIEGFVRINSNGAALRQSVQPYLALWFLAIAYFILATASKWMEENRKMK
ncbi:MAG: ABC transporter permease [Muribaculaceae bacterium]|nr:ABC transporter permease [Muribaculaceae bacterium]